MTDEDKKAVEAVLLLARYCENHGECCDGCPFKHEGEDECPLGAPSWYKIPATLINMYSEDN